MVKKSERISERTLALQETIYNPSYLRSQIEYYKEQKKKEINMCNHKIRFYKKILKECEDPDNPLGKLSRTYKLQ